MNDEFNALILAYFTDQEVHDAELRAYYYLMRKQVDNFIDAALGVGYEPELLVAALREAADDVEQAYNDVDE